MLRKQSENLCMWKCWPWTLQMRCMQATSLCLINECLYHGHENPIKKPEKGCGWWMVGGGEQDSFLFDSPYFLATSLSFSLLLTFFFKKGDNVELNMESQIFGGWEIYSGWFWEDTPCVTWKRQFGEFQSYFHENDTNVFSSCPENILGYL